MAVWKKVHSQKGKTIRETCLYFSQKRYINPEISSEIDDNPYIYYCNMQKQLRPTPQEIDLLTCLQLGLIENYNFKTII